MRIPVALLLVAALVAAWFTFDPLGDASSDAALDAPVAAEGEGARGGDPLAPGGRDAAPGGARAAAAAPAASGDPAREAVAATGTAALVVTARAWDSGNACSYRYLFVDAGEAVRHEAQVEYQATAEELAARGVVVPAPTIGVAPRADSEGGARFEVPAGRALRAFIDLSNPALPATLEPAEGCVVHVDPLAPGEVREVELLVVFPTRAWHLLVLDRETGAPIEGAMVATELEWRRWTSGRDPGRGGSDAREGSAPTRTDAAGRATVRCRTRSHHATVVSAEGYGVVYLPNNPRAEGPESPFVVRLDRAATLRGTVVGLDPDARYFAVAELPAYRLAQPMDVPGWSSGTEWFRASVDDAGRFDLTGLPPNADFELSVRPIGGEAGDAIVLERLSLMPGEELVKRWDLTRVVAIEGVVVDGAGAPLRDAQVVLMLSGKSFRSIRDTPPLQTARTGEDGRFAFAGVPEGDYRVHHVARRSRGEAADSVGVGVRYDEPLDPVRVVVHSGVSLRGRLVAPNGDPVPNALLYARNGSVVASDRTADDGTFDLHPLIAGECSIMISFAAIDSTGAALAAPERLTAVAPAEGVEFALVLAGTIEGRLVDAETGEPVLGMIMVQRAHGEGRRGIRTSKGSAEFAYDSLVPGRYSVVGEANDGRVGALRGLDVRAGETLRDLVVEIEPTVELRVHYGGSRGRAILYVLRDEVAFATEWLDPDAVVDVRVPRGTVELVLTETNAQVPFEERTVYAREVVTLDEAGAVSVELD